MTSDRDLALELLPELGCVRREWSALAERTGNIFDTPEWMQTWWRHFGRGKRLLLTISRDAEGRVMFVLPLYVWRDRPVRVVRLLGHGPGDVLGPVSTPAHRTLAATALIRVLEQHRCDVFIGENLPREDGWSQTLGGKVLRPNASPVLSLEGLTWDAYLSSRSASVRRKIRSTERKLSSQHELRFRLASKRDRLDEDLDALLRLHRARWAKDTSFATLEAFHRDFAKQAFDRGWLRLWFIEVDGEPIAAWLGFRYAGIESYYQSGRDPVFSNVSVGWLALANSIRAAIEDGMREYHFLRGDETFKYELAGHDPGLETIGVARGNLGGLALRFLSGVPLSVLRRFPRLVPTDEVG